MKNCLILGSNSDLGQALAYKFASEGYNITLASRSVSDYQIRLKHDLSIKFGIPVYVAHFESTNYKLLNNFWDSLECIPDVVISVFGYLGNQDLAMEDFNESYRIINSNYVAQVALINTFIKRIKGKKQAAIIGVSSVAGERGRKSNYIYGSAKAGFTTYLSGLRNDLFNDNIHVMTVLPGFIQTKMLGDLKTPKVLTALPKEVANQIFNAYKTKKNRIYCLPIWRWIMLIIRCIPEFIFKRLSL